MKTALPASVARPVACAWARQTSAAATHRGEADLNTVYKSRRPMARPMSENGHRVERSAIE